jgi:hypothetical protein
MGVLSADTVSILGASGNARRPAARRIEWDGGLSEKDGFETFMLKEIHEQPEAVAQTLSAWRAEIRSRDHPILSEALLSTVSRGGDRRVWDLVPRRAGRAHRDRAVGADPCGRGDRLGVPLRGPDRGGAHARPGHHPYHVARTRGLDVDRPRNLAKTVTVE